MDVNEESVVLDEDGNILENPPPEDLDDEAGRGQEDEQLTEQAGEGADVDAVDGETDEQKRERRRVERHNRREHQRQRREEQQRLITTQNQRIMELEGKINALSNRNVSSDMAQLDNALRTTVGHLDTVKERMKAAVEAQNGEALAEAQEEFYETRRRAEHLQSIRQQVAQARRQPQPMDQDVYQMTTDWMSRNRWYDPTAKDRDSRIVKELDRELTDGGWDPKTKDYWDELDARAKKYLPHRYGSSYNGTSDPPPQGRRSQVTGSSRSAGLPGQKRTITLSSERVKAMKEVGVWDDPQARARTIKQYEEWDKANKEH